MGEIANRQLLVFSENGHISQAIPQFHVEWTLHEWKPIARFELRHKGTQVLEGHMTANKH